MGNSFFDLILVFIFIVLPVISNLIRAGQKRGKKGQAKKQQRPENNQPQFPAEQRQVETTQARQRPVVQAEPPSVSDNSKADFERRLAEARARVQQSMETGNDSARGARAQVPQQTRQQTRSQPTARQTQAPRPVSQSRGLEVLNPLGGQPAKARSIESGSLEGQSLERPSLERQFQRPKSQSASRNSAARNQGSIQSRPNASGSIFGELTKRPRAKASVKNPDKLLSMDDKSIMRGLIWKQILDTPKSKKRISAPSQRQSVPSIETT